MTLRTSRATGRQLRRPLQEKSPKTALKGGPGAGASAQLPKGEHPKGDRSDTQQRGTQLPLQDVPANLIVTPRIMKILLLGLQIYYLVVP